MILTISPRYILESDISDAEYHEVGKVEILTYWQERSLKELGYAEGKESVYK